MKRAILSCCVALSLSCGETGGTPTENETPSGEDEEGSTEAAAPAPAQAEADALLAFYNPLLVGLYGERSRAEWVASTDVSEEHTGARTGAATVFSAFSGNAEIIRRARSLLEREDELDDITVRQLRLMLELAASAPMTNPELARARVAAESAQSARLDGFQFCLSRRGDRCAQPVTTNEIDRVLVESRNLTERLNAWRASKEVGADAA